jgi:hypothetical protein
MQQRLLRVSNRPQQQHSWKVLDGSLTTLCCTVPTALQGPTVPKALGRDMHAQCSLWTGHWLRWEAAPGEAVGTAAAAAAVGAARSTARCMQHVDILKPVADTISGQLGPHASIQMQPSRSTANMLLVAALTAGAASEP